MRNWFDVNETQSTGICVHLLLTSGIFECTILTGGGKNGPSVFVCYCVAWSVGEQRITPPVMRRKMLPHTRNRLLERVHVDSGLVDGHILIDLCRFVKSTPSLSSLYEHPPAYQSDSWRLHASL